MAAVPHKFLLLATLVLAAGARFAALDRTPPGIFPDEALNGNEGLHAVETGDFKVFYPANNGREGLWINLTGLSVRYLGANQFGLRFWSAVSGTLAVLFIYLLASELFSKSAALFAAFFLATSYWHLNFSRIDFRAILVPTFSLAALYLLLRAWRSQSYLWAIAGGLVYGLGFHSYIAYRFTPMVVVALFLTKPYRRRASKTITAVWLAAAILAALPIGLYFIKNPQDFFGRAQELSVFAKPEPAKTFAVNLWTTAKMFNRQGDCNPRHNTPCASELPPPIGALFLIGLGLAFFGRAPLWIVVWLGTMILPGALTWEGVPHALRSIGAIPPVFLLTSVGAEAVFKFLQARKKWQWAFLIVIAATGLFEYYRYFAVWANRAPTRDAFSHNLVSIGDYLNALPETTPRFVVISGDPMPAQTLVFVTHGHPNATYISPEQALATKFPSGSVIVPLVDDDTVFKSIRNHGLQVSNEQQPDFTAGVVR